MITSSDPKSNAMLLTIQAQRDGALEQAAMLAGEAAEALAKCAELQRRIDELAQPKPQPALEAVS